MNVRKSPRLRSLVIPSARALGACVSLALGLLVAGDVNAAAPVSLDREVSDITPWLSPYNAPAPAAETAPGEKAPEGFALELANPTNRELHRVVTVDMSAGRILRFLTSVPPQGIVDAMANGEAARATLIDLSGGKAAELRLNPLSTATFAFYVKENTPATKWRLWKPEVIAAAKRTETLLDGISAGAALVMAAWLAGLAVFRRSAEPMWASLALSALIVLILGGTVFSLPLPALQLTGALMVAATLRFITMHLAFDFVRPRFALIFDGAAFAILGFAVAAALGVTDATIYVQLLAIFAPALIAVLSLIESTRSEQRAKALIPGLVLLLIAIFGPGLLPAATANDLTILPLLSDALVVAGALALAFAAALPPMPVVPEETVEELSEKQRKAKENEYRYSLGLAAAHQGLWDWNFETDTLFVSPSVEALLGLEAGALQSSERKWAELIEPEDVPIYADSLNAHRRQGNSSFTLEMRMRHAKGGQRWLQLRASCIANSQGKAVRCIGVVSDVTGRKAQDKAQEATQQHQPEETTDETTGLLLRNAFLSRLDRVVASMQSGQMRRQGAVLAIDVDRVRVVTDSMGHKAGDEFLAQIARRLDHAAGPEDAVARLGTDEFAVLAVGTRGDEDGARVATRIRDALIQPVAIGDKEIYPAASIGLALIEPHHSYAGDVLREAEVAMYHAKRAGRGGFEIYRGEMKPRSADRLIMDADLRKALERGQIELHYQPIMRLEDSSIAGFEALMRWRHPHRGLLSPSEFIALAEETGLIGPLGRYAVQTAAAELKRWQSYFPLREPLFCSVNVSARQLFRDQFFDDVVDVLRREKLARLSLKLELTESVIMQNPDSSARALGRLKEAGAGLALDDFGTGFSSLAYLQRFPFDTVKIDRSFITDMAHNDETPVILRSIIQLAHDLDMSVVAEGVETQAEQHRLRQLRCEFAQGFLFGAPMDATAAYNFIAMKARGSQPSVGRSGNPRNPSSPARIPR